MKSTPPFQRNPPPSPVAIADPPETVHFARHPVRTERLTIEDTDRLEPSLTSTSGDTSSAALAASAAMPQVMVSASTDAPFVTKRYGETASGAYSPV